MLGTRSIVPLPCRQTPDAQRRRGKDREDEQENASRLTPANQQEPRSARRGLMTDAARGALGKTIPQTIPWEVVRGGLQPDGIVSAVNNLALAFARLERAMGIEPTSVAWEATALPLSYARVAGAVYALGRGLRKKSARCGLQCADESDTARQVPWKCRRASVPTARTPRRRG